MYLKSLRIKHFRKFNNSDAEVVFAEGGDYIDSGSKNKKVITNIAPKTTIIVGKNNSGKTTIIKALDILLNKNEKFSSDDFNVLYLNTLASECKSNCDDDEFLIKNTPSIQFDVCIGLSEKNSTDRLSNLYSVLNIADIDTNECTINIKYEIKESKQFIENLQKYIKKYGSENNYFEKYKTLINNSDFQIKYFNGDTEIKDFKLNDLIEFTYIEANTIRDETCLTKAFAKIVNYKYSQDNLKETYEFDDKIDKVNETLSNYLDKKHSRGLNSVIKKILDDKICQISLKSNLSVKSLLGTVIKYYFKEKENDIPETQFGLGYTNLIMIIAQILEYMAKYPETAYNSQVNLIAIEEPETFMHPQMQELFLKNINEIIDDLINRDHKNINSQIIITTHSPHILNSKIDAGGTFSNINYVNGDTDSINVIALNDSKIACLTNEEINKLQSLSKTEIKKIDEKIKATDDSNVKTDKESYRKYCEFEFVKKHIKNQMSEIFFAEAVIFVEGVCEYSLLKYYINKDKRLNKKYLSIVLIDGAHAKMYQNLINLLKIPTLIITDIDIRRQSNEKGEKYEVGSEYRVGEYKQINSLEDRTSTNSTLNHFMKEYGISEKLNEFNYYEKDNLKLVFQKEAVGGYYASSFEEAMILSNINIKYLGTLLKEIKPNIYKRIGGKKIKDNSFEWQCKLENDKTEFANIILFKEMTNRNDKQLFKLPKYINEGLDFLAKKLGE